MTAEITRRTFVGSAVASGLVTIVPRHVLGGSGYVAPSGKITLAHIGMGTQGFREIGGLLADPEIQIVAVCDPNTDSNDYVEWGKHGIRNQIRSYLGEPNWREGDERLPRRPRSRPAGGGHVLRETARRGEVPSLLGLRRFPRTAGQGAGPGRRQGHDAGPSARRRSRLPR